MKQFCFYCSLMVALAFVAGCQPEMISTDDSAVIPSGALTIKATWEEPEVGNPQTKTVLRTGDDNKEHVYWVPGDAISLFYGSGWNGGSKFTAQAAQETRVTNFSGEIGVVTGGDEIAESDTYFWGIYPYDPDSYCSNQAVGMNISPVQLGAPDTFASGYAPSLGRAEGLMLAFKNIYSGIWFTVSEPGFLQMVFSSNHGEPIAGQGVIGIGDNGDPELLSISYTIRSTSVTVEAPTPAGFEVGKKYYALFFPGTLANGFTIELKSASRTGRFTVNSSIPFKRNQISNVANLDTKCSFTDNPGLGILAGDGSKVWKWSVLDGQCWGNAGYIGSSTGYDVAAGEIPGKWWGSPPDELETYNISHSGHVAYGYGDSDAYMVFSQNGECISYKSDGTPIASGAFMLDDYDPGCSDGYLYGRLKTIGAPILFPFAANTLGKKVNDFEVVYIDADNLTLINNYQNCIPESWGECTWWRFKSVSDSSADTETN